MCGTRLGSEVASKNGGAKPLPEPVSAQPAGRASSTTLSILGLESEAPSRTRERASERSSPIAGPSFLGLSSGSSSADPSYLLDDEEESGSHVGLWVFLVLLVAALGTGFHFRNELRTRATQAYAAIQARVNPQPEAPSQTMPATPTDPHTDSPTISTESSKQGQPENAPAAAAKDQSQAEPQKDTAESAKPDDKSAKDNAAEESTAKQSAEAEKAAPAVGSKANQDEETRPARKAAGRQTSLKSRTPQTSPEDNRLLQLARRYIHGQGVPRNCEQGLTYLRQAVRRSNPEAASQMGALYATGTCVAQDKVQAYRWFGAALQQDPNNSYLSRERDELYGQMTSAERHQADR